MASGGKLSSLDRSRVPAKAPKHILQARDDLGTKEWTYEGKRKVPNPVVQAWSEKALGYSVNTIEVPWCAIYTGLVLIRAGYTGTRSAMARSYLKWGTTVDKDDSSEWCVGDVVVMWRGSHNDGVTGHVYFALEWDEDTITGIGGNQGDMVCIQTFPRSKVLGIRRPRTQWDSNTIKAAAVSVVSKVAEKTADLSLPDPDKIEQLVAQTRAPVESMLGGSKPWIIGFFAMLSLAAGLYAIWCRMSDFKSGRNA